MPYDYVEQYAPNYSKIEETYPTYTSSSANAPTGGIAWWANGDEGTADMWNVFFKDYYPLNASEHDAFSKAPDYYHNLFGSYLKRWYDSVDDSMRGNYNGETSYSTIKTSWTHFLGKTDVVTRRNSPFLWVFSLLNDSLGDIQQIMVQQSDRITVLTKTQQDAISAISAIYFPYYHHTPGTSFDGDFAKDTKVTAAKQQVYLARKGLQQEKIHGVDASMSASNQAVSQVDNLLSTLLSQLRDILAAAFKP